MFDFPASPSVGQIFQPSGGPAWQWDGTVWQSAAGAAPIITPFVPYTPVCQGLGTITNVAMFSRRVGDCLHVKGRFQSGVSTAVEARVALGFNGVSGNVFADPVKATLNEHGGSILLYFAGAIAPNAIIIGGANYLNLGWQSASAFGFTPQQGTAFGNNCYFAFDAWIPIAGWGADTPAVAVTPTRQSFPVGGSTGVNIAVPSTAKIAKITGALWLASGSQAPYLRLSADGSTFLSGATDYAYGGIATFAGSAASPSKTAAATTSAWQLCNTSDHAGVAQLFEVTLTLAKDTAVSKPFSAFWRGMSYMVAATNYNQELIWNGYTNNGAFYTVAQLPAFQIIPSSGSWAAGSHISVDWMY